MIFLFLDGVGIGNKSKSNPFYLANSDYLPFYMKSPTLPDGTPVKPIDPLLGVPGIPQSATGQSTIYTGRNIPKLLGAHSGSFPNRRMRQIIKKENIFRGLAEQGFKPVFLNAYPNHAQLFQSPNICIKESGEFVFSEKFPRRFKRRISVTSCMMISNGMIPFDLEDIRNHESIYQDYTNLSLIHMGARLPEFSPETAAEVIYRASKKVDFLLYEYFLTDLYGHRKSVPECTKLVSNLNRLVKHLIGQMNRKTDSLLLCSDHGNIEFPPSKTHTQNPVPLICWGKGSDFLQGQINDLSDITPAIYSHFNQTIQTSKLDSPPSVQGMKNCV